MSEDSLIVDRARGAVWVLTLNRPERRNALNTALLQRLAEVLSEADRDAGCRAVVITGDAKAFAAGADVDEIAEAGPQQALTDPRVAAWAAIRACRTPVIAAVEGYCLGGGLELALACDIIIAAEGAKLGLPEVKIGLMPGAGGTQVLPRMVGKSLAMKLALSGEFISGREAQAAGLAAEAVPDGQALARALALAEVIAANAPFAVESAKQSILSAFRTPLDEGLRTERALFAVLQATADKNEGIRALKEKRKPNFQGR